MAGMVNHAAPQTDSPPDADLGIAPEILTLWRDRTLSWQRSHLGHALASFTFVADLTTLAQECRFAGDSRALVARYDGLPFAAIAFCSRAGMNGDIPGHLATLTRRLVASRETFTCLVAEKDWPLLRAAYDVLERRPEWQMSFCADPNTLDAGGAVALGPSSLQDMRALSRREGMQAFERDPFRRGIWHGVWRDGTLVAQGGTHLLLERAAEIGNIVTAKAFRRRGYGSQVVAALVRELSTRKDTVFLHVLKENEGALAFYQHLGFERQRTMILARCRV